MKFFALSFFGLSSALFISYTNADSGPCFKSGVEWTDASSGGGADSSDILAMCQNHFGGTYSSLAQGKWCLSTTGSNGQPYHIDFQINNLRASNAYMDPNGCHDYFEQLMQQCPRGADESYTDIEWEFRFDPNSGVCGSGTGDISA